MTINEVGTFLLALADPTVKSKHFSIDSLVDIAYLKKKVSIASEKYSDIVETMAVKVKKSKDGRSYLQLDVEDFKSNGSNDDVELKNFILESKQNYEDFIKKNAELRLADIEGLKLNFIPKEEIKKVVDETSLEIATTLIVHLVKIE